MNTSPLKRRSIRSALLLYLVPAGIACLAFAWMMHGQLLDRMPERFLESQLKEEVAFLERRIIALDGDLARLDPGDYLQEVFHHAIAIKTKEATVIVPPNWEPLLAPLFESNQIGLIRATQSALKQIPKQIVAYRQQFVVNQQAVVILVAEDIDAMKQSQSELHAWTAIASILLMGLFVLMLWFGVNYSMRPVTKLQQELDQLKSGEIARISDDAPDEFNALIWQLNQLLDTLETRVAKSREALANLSHSVKTPMTAVRQILVDQQRPLDPMLRTQLATQLEGINTQLEAELRRSRFAGPQIGVSAAPIVKARELIWMFGQLHPEKSFELLSTLEHDVRWPIEEYDLNEVLGNLLETPVNGACHL